MTESGRGITTTGPVAPGGVQVGDPVRTGWDDVSPAGESVTELDDLADVEPGGIGVLTRSSPTGKARFQPLPTTMDPPPPPEQHVQLRPAERWQIIHHLGWRPAFAVHDSDGRPHLPQDVEHPVPGVISEIVFGLPMAGTADPS